MSSEDRKQGEPAFAIDPAPFGPLGAESYDMMLNNMRASMRAWEVFGAAWLGFCNEQVRRWSEFCGSMGEAHSGEELWRRQSDYLQEMMRAYGDAFSQASTAAGNVMGADLERQHRPPLAAERKRVA
jgi:hypothetical protein